jgi:hypothetical protein
MVCLVYDNNFKSLSGGLVNLLCLGDFLEQILDNDAIVITNIGWCDLEVVDRGHNIKFEFAAAAGLEDARIDLDLLYSRSIELFQCSDNTGLLACAGGSVDKEMREVAALCLKVTDRRMRFSRFLDVIS